MATRIIDVVPADASQGSYGITHTGALVYDVTGRGVRNRHHPHRVVVWSNEGRPNTRDGEPVRDGDYGKLDGGEGRYLETRNNATNSPVTIIVDAEEIAITNNGTGTGTVASGQVYGDETLTIGDCVILRWPGGVLSLPYRLVARPLADPELVPVEWPA
jgi:hypothetical protein